MDTLAIIVIAVLALFLLLAIGGAVAGRRRQVAGEPAFRAQIDQANRDLASAHAADRGWEPARVEAAAREAFAVQRPGARIDELALIQVVDPPGTEDDRAVFRVRAGPEAHRLTLGRRGDDWLLERFE